MRQLLRKRESLWRFAAALVLATLLSGVVPEAAFAQDDLQQPTAVSTGSPDGGKPPHRKCTGSNGSSQTDTQCGW